MERRAGFGIDPSGGAVVDPTKNVLDLVKAESKYQDAMRDALEKLLDVKVEGANLRTEMTATAMVAYQNAQVSSETRRIDQLAQTRQEFQNTIRDMLAESVRTTSTLVSTQLVQIQATFDTRVSKLEAGAFTQAGKSSVADPQTAEAIARMSAGLIRIQSTQDDALSKMTQALSSIQSNESRSGGRDMGKSDTNARLLSVVMAVAAVASPVIAILVTIMAMRGK